MAAKTDDTAQKELTHPWATPGGLNYLMMEAMASAVYYSLSFYLLPYRAFVQVSRTEKKD